LLFYIDPVPYVCPPQHWQIVLCSPRQTNSPSISTVCILPTLVCTFLHQPFFGGGEELKIYKNKTRLGWGWGGLLVK
jgi:hypothetical protein